MDGPVIQEMAVSDDWRRRQVRLWTTATGAVMKAEELARRIEYYRDEPAQRRALS
jgi:hypothetical protein